MRSLKAAVTMLLLVSGARASSQPEHLQVSLVLLDAVVTDKAGQPVRGLGAGDFDLLVDNSRVAIESVEDHCGEPPPGGAIEASMAADAAGPRRFILFFDVSHMQTLPRRNAIKSALAFVDQHMTDRDQTMVLAFLRGLHVIAPFTADRQRLRERLTFMLDDRSTVDPSPTEEATMLDRLNMERRRRELGLRTGALSREPSSRMSAGSGSVPGAIASECGAEARLSEMDAARTLGAMASAMPAFGAVPGRKALIYYGETLRANPGLPYFESCGVAGMSSPSMGLTVLPAIDDLALKANLAGVSLYPVHASGMSELKTTAGEHSAIDLEAGMARSTGGRNSLLMNDATASFKQAMKDMSCYYVVSYRPPDGFGTGRHNVRLTMVDRKLRVRHREFFTIQSPSAASETQLMAALSSPGLYRDLKVDVHGYSLMPTSDGRRQLVLKAAVPIKDLMLLPAPGGGGAAAVTLRGAIVEGNDLRCQFTRQLMVEQPAGKPDSNAEVGVETICALEPGEHEIVVAARDEASGSIGAFWGRTQIRLPGNHAGPGPLLWAGGGQGTWVHDAGKDGLAPPAPDLFIRRSSRLSANESAALTFIACRPDGARKPRRVPGPEPSVVHLDGEVSLDLPAHEVDSGGETNCRLLKAEIPAGTLAPGSYLVLPEAPPPWRALGEATSLEVSPGP